MKGKKGRNSSVHATDARMSSSFDDGLNLASLLISGGLGDADRPLTKELNKRIIVVSSLNSGMLGEYCVFGSSNDGTIGKIGY